MVHVLSLPFHSSCFKAFFFCFYIMRLKQTLRLPSNQKKLNKSRKQVSIESSDYDFDIFDDKKVTKSVKYNSKKLKVKISEFVSLFNICISFCNSLNICVAFLENLQVKFKTLQTNNTV